MCKVCSEIEGCKKQKHEAKRKNTVVNTVTNGHAKGQEASGQNQKLLLRSA